MTRLRFGDLDLFALLQEALDLGEVVAKILHADALHGAHCSICNRQAGTLPNAALHRGRCLRERGETSPPHRWASSLPSFSRPRERLSRSVPGGIVIARDTPMSWKVLIRSGVSRPAADSSTSAGLRPIFAHSSRSLPNRSLSTFRLPGAGKKPSPRR